MAGYTFGDMMRSLLTKEELEEIMPLLHIERSQLRWLSYLIGMPLVHPLERCSGHVSPGGGLEEDLGHAAGSLDWLRKAFGK